MIRRFVVLGASLWALSAAQAAHAAGGRGEDGLSPLSISLGGGTTGVEIGAAYAVNSKVVLRAQAASLNFNRNFSSTYADYSGGMKFNTRSATAEVHPFGGGLFAAGGVMTGVRKVSAAGKPTGALKQSIVINGVSYAISQIVQVKGDIDLGGTAPYFGLGWDNTFSGGGHWGLCAALGVTAGDVPTATLSASGPLAKDPTVKANLIAEQKSLAAAAKDLKYYPVATVSLAYRF